MVWLSWSFNPSNSIAMLLLVASCVDRLHLVHTVRDYSAYNFDSYEFCQFTCFTKTVALTNQVISHCGCFGYPVSQFVTIFKMYIYNGAACVPTFDGTHASSRAGLHSQLFDSILDRVKNVNTHNHSLRVQYVR